MLGRSPVLCVIWQILYRPSDRQALFDRRVAAKASYCPNNLPLDNFGEGGPLGAGADDQALPMDWAWSVAALGCRGYDDPWGQLTVAG